MIRQLTGLLAGSLFWCMGAVGAVSDVADEVAPEGATGRMAQSLVSASDFMVAAANPYGVNAGYQILKQGGTAVDAMIATQLVLNLVEPQSSGIGGGAFALYFDGRKQRLTSWDGRETAPASVTPELFLDSKGEPLSFYDAVVGGRSVGTPGTLKLMKEMHQRYGKLSWKALFKPAIELASNGFKVSPRLAALVARDRDRLSRYPVTGQYFFPEGKAIQSGDILKNADFAETLTLLAEKGIQPFYQGEIAHDLVAAVRSAKDNPGVLSLDDLKNYRVIERKPVCLAYRGFNVCGMGPPSSGALTVGQILGMLEPYDIRALGPDNPQSWRLIGDASRLAFADRGLYMADTDFVSMPKGLLEKQYLQSRSRLLNGDKAMTEVYAGAPPEVTRLARSPDESIELPSTSHISIVDALGNVVSMTTTIENGFGSRVMVGGFLLNNELTDFSFRSSREGKPIANRIEPGKRPRSSMAPTVVMKEGKPYLVIGSPGGSRIIGYVAKTLIAHLDWQLPLDEAINLPHRVNRFGTYDLEEGTSAEYMAASLKQLGYDVKVRELNSGLHGILVTAEGLQGAADIRREGAAMGD